MSELTRRYSYRIQWSDEDDEFVATVAELPSLSWLADNEIDALRGIHTVVDEALETLSEDGEDAPQPFADRHYSGKFTLRLPPQAHRKLAVEAAEQGVSINRYAAMKLESA
ncbi:type II toxin-antitoxin system HicB family antitoxin [Bifidobacterium crudilactis]|jgi:predicted HicB family RNase H-like nuclease|uniref:type II toxin-antitoxin system HicB family antitoxin n=1 Tax=Bifidobacterium crudilactis TaxID=327277 RepID=UPI0005586757|nr:type II toxin-antitoxin system HicB family antitoxin [Bifidobacterium crudilactis]MCI2148650.1 type II toxin-antitoxin system HicB family antitoxin [Bifidobacterium crudilactis]MCI2157743.1 type II toxin-antitoxin system HicB family antitoxin [Bifidobacterium crudilactis]